MIEDYSAPELAEVMAQWYEAADCAGSENFLHERQRRSQISPEEICKELAPEYSAETVLTAYGLYKNGLTEDWHHTGSRGEVATRFIDGEWCPN